MSPTDVFLIAIRGLAGNKLRAVLTLLGVVIGVGAVISVMAIGRGSSAAITEQIESIGTNLIFVRAGASTDQGVRGAQGSAATLTLSDAEALEDPFLAPGHPRRGPGHHNLRPGPGGTGKCQHAYPGSHARV